MEIIFALLFCSLISLAFGWAWGFSKGYDAHKEFTSHGVKIKNPVNEITIVPKVTIKKRNT